MEEMISKEDKQYMGTEQYKQEHDAQAYKASLRELLDRGFTLRQIQALENQAEEVFGKPSKLKGGYWDE
jgi:hypothetical protein